MSDFPSWHPYVIYESALPTSMCDDIINIHRQNDYHKGGLLKDGKDLYNFGRNSRIQGTDLQWLQALIIGYVRMANHSNFHYDLSDDYSQEYMQFSRYDIGMYFDRHMDFDVQKSTAHTRKLSVTVQLSDTKDYRGGDLVLENCKDGKFICPKAKGTVIVFDSRWWHKVTPVIFGTRYSIVKWIHGDQPLR
tara:strand:- start:18 stop:590 length:573 start_codon:yes stop_codon:yes gene_type:complete